MVGIRRLAWLGSVALLLGGCPGEPDTRPRCPSGALGEWHLNDAGMQICVEALEYSTVARTYCPERADDARELYATGGQGLSRVLHCTTGLIVARSRNDDWVECHYGHGGTLMGMRYEYADAPPLLVGTFHDPCVQAGGPCGTGSMEFERGDAVCRITTSEFQEAPNNCPADLDEVERLRSEQLARECATALFPCGSEQVQAYYPFPAIGSEVLCFYDDAGLWQGGLRRTPEGLPQLTEGLSRATVPLSCQSFQQCN